jgi:hypothetical protein
VGIAAADRSRSTAPTTESLGTTLGFVDDEALYRVLPWNSEETLVIRVERTPFSSFCR